MESITKELAEFVVQSTYRDFPEGVIAQAKRCFVDWMGVTLAAADSPTARILIDLVRELGGQKQASIVRPNFKTTVLNASLVNGTMAHVLDFDDVHPQAVVHSSAVLVPAALSGGEWKRRNGKEIIAAFVAGYEVAARVSLAAGKGTHQIELGWHPTSTIGRIGAAVCFGKLLGLDPHEMATSIGIAATQAAGLKKVFGTMTKPFHSGKAAHDGVLAALLASRGMSAPIDILEGKNGLCQVLSQQFDEKQILDGLGKRFEILNNWFKVYPSCGQTHAVIESCLDILKKFPFESSSVKEVVCEVSPNALEGAGIRNPRDGNEAKFSLYYCAARALMGDVSLSRFADEEIENQDANRLMERIKIRTNPSFKTANAVVELSMKDGRKIESKVDGLKGGPSHPMTNDELDEKFMQLVLPVMNDENKVKDVLHALRSFEKLRDIKNLLSLLT